MANYVKFFDAVGLIPLEISQEVKDFYANADGNITNTKPLRIRIAATHAAKVTRNNGFYLPHKMQAGVKSFTDHYSKPIQIHHEDKKDPIGRVYKASYIDLSKGFRAKVSDFYTVNQDKKLEDFIEGNLSWQDAIDYARSYIINDAKLKDDPDYEGLGYIELIADITDPSAIQKILDGRYLTGSVGATTNKAICSICKTDWAADGKCVVPGTEITLANGLTKPIEDIKSGDYIITHSGSTGKVTQVLKRQYNGNLIVLDRIGTNQPLFLTEGHPVYCNKIKTIKHRFNKTEKRERVKALVESMWINSECLDGNGYLSIPLFEKNKEKISDLDIYSCAFLGLYAAEGSNTNSNCLELSIHKDEISLFDHYFKNINQDYKIYKRKENESVSCRFSNKYWKEMCDKHTGQGALTKILSDEIVFGSTENIKAFLGAFIDGDGCFTKDQNKVKIYTASKNLARQILSMCHRINIFPNFYKEKNSGGPTNREKECWIYEVQISKSQINELTPFSIKLQEYHQGTKASAQKIVLPNDASNLYFKYNTFTEKYNGIVYNLEVESEDNAHSYIANDIAIHNCKHKPGQLYDGTKCVLIAGDLSYDEYSFVNRPADRHSRVIEVNVNGIQDFVTLDEQAESHIPEITLVVDQSNYSEEDQNMTFKDAFTLVSQDERFKNLENLEDSIKQLVDENKDLTKEHLLELMAEKLPQQKEIKDKEEEEKDPVKLFWGDEYDEIVGDDSWGKNYAEMMADEEVRDAKLSADARKKLPKSVFCKPPDGYPVQDCAHAKSAMAYAKKYNESASVIACIKRKAARLGCPFKDENKKTDATDSPEGRFEVGYFDHFEDDELGQLFIGLQAALTERKLDCCKTLEDDERVQKLENALQDAKQNADKILKERLDAARKEIRYLHADIDNLTNSMADAVEEVREARLHHIADLSVLSGKVVDIKIISNELKEKSGEEIQGILKDISGKVDRQKIIDTLNSGLSNNPAGTVENPTLVQDNVTNPEDKKEKEEKRLTQDTIKAVRRQWLMIRQANGQEAADKFLEDCKTQGIIPAEWPVKDNS